jgi:hypothetical protein
MWQIHVVVMMCELLLMWQNILLLRYILTCHQNLLKNIPANTDGL